MSCPWNGTWAIFFHNIYIVIWIYPYIEKYSFLSSVISCLKSQSKIHWIFLLEKWSGRFLSFHRKEMESSRRYCFLTWCLFLPSSDSSFTFIIFMSWKIFIWGQFFSKNHSSSLSDLSLINQKIILPTGDFSLNSYNQYCNLYFLCIAFDSYFGVQVW